MTRVDGKLIRVTLGKHPALSLAQARDEARRVMNLAAAGRDPRRIRTDEKRKLEAERRNTFAACADEFMEKHAQRHLRLSTQREYLRVLKGVDTRAWQDSPISQITKRHVLDVIEAIDSRGSPGAAKRNLVYLRKFFNWCAERDIIATPPTDRIRAPYPEVRRDRVLAEEELRYLLRALDTDYSLFGPLFSIVLFTGQRRGEVAGMEWSELRDVDRESAVWEIPGSRTKNKHSHLVPLSPAVRDLLKKMPRVGDLVFTTTLDTSVSGFGKAKLRIDLRLNELRRGHGLEPMAPWTLHDLRRTMVTVMNEKLNVAPHVVEAAVNHLSGLSKAGVAGIYNRALYLEDRKRALLSWSNYLNTLQPKSRK
jgi:integrase